MPNPFRLRRFGRLGLVAALIGLAGTGCGSDPAPPPPARLTASTTQFRPDEGTHRLSSGVTNTGSETIHLTAARLVWPGLGGRTTGLDETLGPGESAAFPLTFTTPTCSGPVTAPPQLRLVVDRRVVTVPLHVDIPGLLERLRLRECGLQDLASSVQITWGPGRVVGRNYLSDLTLTPIPGGKDVQVIDTGGSVLLRLIRKPIRHTASARVLPLVITPVDRCDGHAQGQSQQTFLLSVFFTVGGSDPVRYLLPIDDQRRADLQGLMDRYCTGQDHRAQGKNA